MFRVLISIVLVISCTAVLAQKTTENIEALPYIYATGSANMPGGDFKERFGYTTSVGAGLGYKFENNWLLNFESSYIFGQKVNEDPLQNLYTSDGYLTTIYGEPAFIKMEMSGWNARFEVGKIFPVFKSNTGSGLLIKASGGILSHKILITNEENSTYQIQDAYRKGYDRLCYGMALTQFIGWNHFSDARGFHFFAGFEVTEGFTENRRSYDYQLHRRLTGNRTDLLYSLKLGIYIPLKSRRATGYYYY